MKTRRDKEMDVVCISKNVMIYHECKLGKEEMTTWEV